MKSKIIIITLTFILQSTLLYSQVIKDVGIKVGLSSSNIFMRNIKPSLTNYVVDYPSGQLVSPTISLWAKIIEDKIIDIEIETSYLLKGASETQTAAVVSTNQIPFVIKYEDSRRSFDFKYLQFNINSQIKYQIDKIGFYGIVGPSLNYLLTSDNYLLEKELKKNFILGYNLGIGLDFSELINKKIFVEARYSGDFTEFYNDTAELWNNIWLFNLGTKF